MSWTAGFLEEALTGVGDEIYICGDWQRMTGKLGRVERTFGGGVGGMGQ